MEQVIEVQESEAIVLRETLVLKLIASQLDNMLYNLRQSGDIPKANIIRALENILETTNTGLKSNDRL